MAGVSMERMKAALGDDFVARVTGTNVVLLGDAAEDLLRALPLTELVTALGALFGDMLRNVRERIEDTETPPEIRAEYELAEDRALRLVTALRQRHTEEEKEKSAADYRRQMMLSLLGGGR